MKNKDYQELERVLDLVLERASGGKGLERHANQKPFHEQEIVREGEHLGISGHLYQIRKKALETRRIPIEDAKNELLDIAVYACAAYLILENME